MFTLVLLLAFSKGSPAKDANDMFCTVKPWLCEDQNCPKNEEKINDQCRCVVGFDRNKKTKACEPIL